MVCSEGLYVSPSVQIAAIITTIILTIILAVLYSDCLIPIVSLSDQAQTIAHMLPAMYYTNEEKCVGCGECVEICPVDVYEIKDEKSIPVNAEECLGCEEEAITVTEI